MGELSDRLMVSNGNVTGLVDAAGARGPGRRARRAQRPPPQRVRLTPPGRRAFEAMTPTHERWIDEHVRGLRRAETARLLDRCSASSSARSQAQPADDEGRCRCHRDSADRLRAAAFRLGGRRPRRDDHAQPARAQEPADVRVLRRAARPVPRSGRCATTSAPWSSPAPAATSAPAATCTRSSARWSQMRRSATASCCAFTRMTGELVKAMRACPQPIVAAIDGVCAGAGAMHRHGVRPAARHGAQQGRVPVRARRPRRRRHGRLRAAAAHHRPGPRRASCCTPAASMDGDEAERWGFYNRARRARSAARRGADAGARARRRPDLRPRHDQDACSHQEWNMGVDAGDRGRGAGAGDLHADRGLRARLPRVRRQGEAACSRAN